MLVDMKQFHVVDPVWAKLPAISLAFDRHPSTEWVWWLDIDAIIMTSHIDLYNHVLSPAALKRLVLKGQLIKTNERVPMKQMENILTNDVHPLYPLTFQNTDPSKIDIICVEDKAGLNLGSFFIRNTEIMKLFIELWNDPILTTIAHGKFKNKEQDLFLHLILHHAKIRERVAFIPQRIINSYQDMDDERVRWHPGDLVVHFPNCGLVFLGCVDVRLHRCCVERFEKHWPQREILELEREVKAPPPSLVGVE